MRYKLVLIGCSALSIELRGGGGVETLFSIEEKCSIFPHDDFPLTLRCTAVDIKILCWHEVPSRFVFGAGWGEGDAMEGVTQWTYFLIVAVVVDRKTT